MSRIEGFFNYYNTFFINIFLFTMPDLTDFAQSANLLFSVVSKLLELLIAVSSFYFMIKNKLAREKRLKEDTSEDTIKEA